MDIETKLQRFSEVVRKEAEELKSKKVGLVDEKYELSVNEFEEKTRKKYEAMAEEAEMSAEREKQKLIAQKIAAEKRLLIQKRNEYINVVFENVLGKLNAFFQTPEYEELLAGYIKSYTDGGGATAYIMRRDIALRERLAERTGVNVVVVDEDFLGGVRVSLAGSRVADCTLKRRFEAEKAAFNKIRV